MTRAAMLLLPMLLVACGKRSEPDSRGSPPATVTQPPAPAGSLAWDTPPTWTTVPHPSTMRKATYRIPRAEGAPDDADMTVMQAGGSVDANVARWATQFEGGKELLKREPRTVGGYKVTVVEIVGTFMTGAMPGAPSVPRHDWQMLGAIVETPSGLWFFKLVGPQKSVSAARADFEKLVSSFRGA